MRLGVGAFPARSPSRGVRERDGKVKVPRRAPREVYRVFDEEEFLEDATRELSTPPADRVRLDAVGALVLMVGLVSVIGWLLASAHRTHGKPDPAPHERTGRTAVAAAVHPGKVSSSTSHASRPRRSGYPQIQGRPRRRTVTRAALLSHRRGGGTVSSMTSGDDASAVMMARASESQSVREVEFGFER